MSDASPGPVRQRGAGTGARRAEGLAGGGHRYTLTVAALVTLSSLPTLAAIAAGSAALDTGTRARSPFAAGRAGPPVVVVPDRQSVGAPTVSVPDPHLPPPPDGERRPARPAQPRPAHRPVEPRPAHRAVEPRPAHRAADPRTRVDHRPAGRQRWRSKPAAAGKAAGHAPGRSIGGWRRPAGPRR